MLTDDTVIRGVLPHEARSYTVHYEAYINRIAKYTLMAHQLNTSQRGLTAQTLKGLIFHINFIYAFTHYWDRSSVSKLAANYNHDIISHVEPYRKLLQKSFIK